MKKNYLRIIGMLTFVLVLACGMFVFVSCGKRDDSVSTPDESGSVSATAVMVTLVSENYESSKFQCKPGSALPTVEVENKDFEGYWTDQSYTAKYEYTTVPDSNLTLYYKLKNQTYSIELNFGDGRTFVVEARRGVNENLPTVSPVGTTLVGYALTEGGTPEYYAAATSENGLKGLSVKDLAEKDGKATLYAVYEIDDVADFDVEGEVVKGYNGEKTEITLPYGCTEVAENAFSGNTSLKVVTVPSTYYKIGKGAFGGCTSLETLNAPFIGGSRMNNRFLAYVFGADKYEDNNYSFAAYRMNNSLYMGDMHLENLVIPQSFKTFVVTEPVEEIPEGAFYSAYSLENVTLVYPEEVRTVGEKAFMNCMYLGRDSNLNVYIKMDWLSYVETFGKNAFTAYYGNYESSVKVIYPYGEDYPNYQATLLEYPYPFSNLVELPVLKNVEEIGEEAFAYCSSIQNIEFGNNLTKIGKSAFFYNMLNTELELPDSLREIGEQAFYANLSLYKVTFGSGIKNIRARAFANCSVLSQVEFTSANVPTVENYAFCNTLTSSNGPTGDYIYEATYDEISVLVPENAVNDYKDVFSIIADRVVTPAPVADPVYWFDFDGNLMAKFEFRQGGTVYVTDKNQTFISSVDYGAGTDKTYSATCGEYYPMNYEFLTDEEYEKTAATERYGKHTKPLYKNQRILHLWHPELVDAFGNTMDLYLIVNDLKYTVDGVSYILPTVNETALTLSYAKEFGTCSADYVGSYFVSRNKYGAVKIGKVVNAGGGAASINWLDDPEGTYYMEFEEVDDNNCVARYYDKSYNIIKETKFVIKHIGDYSQWGDPLYEADPKYTTFAALTTYNDSNKLYLDGLGNADIKIGDNTYRVNTITENTKNFGNEDYEIDFTNISMNGVMTAGLTGKAVFGKVGSNGEYYTITVTIGDDSYEFVNVTYDSGWFTRVYGEYVDMKFNLPKNSGDLTDDAWRYEGFTDITTGDTLRVYIFAPSDDIGKAEYAYYREYNDDGLYKFGTFTIKADGTMVFGEGDDERTTELSDKRGSFNMIDADGNVKKYIIYHESEDMTLVYTESFYGTTLYYYTVKADGFGNMYVYDEHDDDYDDVYIGTYDDYDSFTIGGNTYYELVFSGEKVDAKGNMTGEKKSYWILYTLASFSYYDGYDSDCMWVGAIAAIFDNHDDKTVNVYDDFGNLVYEITVDVYGNNVYTKYAYTLNRNGSFTAEVVEVATEKFVPVTNSNGDIEYLIAIDENGDSIFTVKPMEGKAGMFVITKEKGVIASTATESEVKVDIDFTKLNKVA